MTIEQERLTPTQEELESWLAEIGPLPICPSWMNSAVRHCQRNMDLDVTEGFREPERYAGEPIARIINALPTLLAALKSPPIGGEDSRDLLPVSAMSDMTKALLTTSGDVGKLCERLLALDDETMCFDGNATYALIHEAAARIAALEKGLEQIVEETKYVPNQYASAANRIARALLNPTPTEER